MWLLNSTLSDSLLANNLVKEEKEYSYHLFIYKHKYKPKFECIYSWKMQKT